MKAKTEDIKSRLVDVNKGHKFNSGWAEGYVSALTDYEVITEYQFDELIEFIKRMVEAEYRLLEKIEQLNAEEKLKMLEGLKKV